MFRARAARLCTRSAHVFEYQKQTKFSCLYPNLTNTLKFLPVKTYQSLISVLLFTSRFCHCIKNNFVSVSDLVKCLFGKCMIKSSEFIQIYSLESVIHIGFRASVPQLLKLKMLYGKVVLISASYTCGCLKYR